MNEHHKKCTYCGQVKPRTAFYAKKYVDNGKVRHSLSGPCRVCHYKQRGHRTRAEYLRIVRKKWGLVCEDYIGNGITDMKQLSARYNLSMPTISKILSLYFGNGKPITLRCFPE